MARRHEKPDVEADAAVALDPSEAARIELHRNPAALPAPDLRA
jgi:hypothetical protein